jgi:hypothetical protein
MIFTGNPNISFPNCVPQTPGVSRQKLDNNKIFPSRVHKYICHLLERSTFFALLMSAALGSRSRLTGMFKHTAARK